MIVWPFFYNHWQGYEDKWVLFILSLDVDSRRVKSKQITFKLFNLRVIITLFLYGICLDILKEGK